MRSPAAIVMISWNRKEMVVDNSLFLSNRCVLLTTIKSYQYHRLGEIVRPTVIHKCRKSFGELDLQISQQGKNAGSSFSPLIFRLFLVGGRLKIDPIRNIGNKEGFVKQHFLLIMYLLSKRIVSYI